MAKKRGTIGGYSRKKLESIIEDKHNSLGTGDGGGGGGGSTDPAGSDTQIQFNDGGSFGASANFTFDDTNVELSGNLAVSGSIKFEDISTGTGASTSSYLALDANNNVILTSSVGEDSGGAGDGTIGNAED